MKNPGSIDEFISTYPKSTQAILQELRHVVQKVVPEAKETIAYGIPTFTLNSKNLVHFSAYARHIGFYPGSGPIKDFQLELKPYKTSKGTVQFLINHPLPIPLITQMVKAAVKRNLAKKS